VSRLALVFVVTAAAVGEALFPPKLIQVALGYPIRFCPAGALASAITAGHFIALGSFVFVVLFLLRLALPMPWRVILAAVVGSVTAASTIWWFFAQPPVWSRLLDVSGSIGAAWDAARCTKALGTGVGGLVGTALASARQNNKMQQTRRG